MTAHPFLKLQDLVLAPPLPAALSLLMAAGIAHLGWLLARRLRGDEAEALDVAAGFIVAAALIAAAVHGLALAQLSTIAILRPVGWALAAVGGYAVVRHRRRVVAAVRREAAALGAGPLVDRACAILVGLALVGLAAAALGPPTDADSLDYHLGVPMDWLRHGGAYARADWFHARLVGIGESLNMLGLVAGTDVLGAALQLGGLIAAATALRALADTPRDRLLAWLLVAACPTVAFLVPNEKPQMLPTAATTVALVLAVKRFSTFRAADAALALGCAAFAAASKLSFILSVGFVVLACLVAARRSGRLAVTLGIGAAAFVVLLLPVLGRNLAFYGDPLSPFLERLRPHPDRILTSWAAYVRVSAGDRSAANLIRLPLQIVATTTPGALTTVLGLGGLAFLPALGAAGKPRALLAVALACALATVVFGQLAPRFFLEPYLWAGAALVAAPWRRSKLLLLRGLELQGALTAAIALYGAATLFPGALTAHERDTVMLRAAAGYAEAQWLDRVLPPDAVMVRQSRFHAFAPRPFVVADRVIFGPGADERDLARLTVASGVNSLVVVEGSTDTFARLSRLCGEPLGPAGVLPIATRNPFNRGQYQATAFHLRGCERIAESDAPRGGRASGVE
jgi:hypothetical protein